MPAPRSTERERRWLRKPCWSLMREAMPDVVIGEMWHVFFCGFSNRARRQGIRSLRLGCLRAGLWLVAVCGALSTGPPPRDRLAAGGLGLKPERRPTGKSVENSGKLSGGEAKGTHEKAKSESKWPESHATSTAAELTWRGRFETRWKAEVKEEKIAQS